MKRIGGAGYPRVSAGAFGAAFLFVVYALTLAPDVTFWDAGEFIASVHSLGIPHPPGTPLFILMEHVWAQVLFFLPYAIATNIFSAVATAIAGGISARLVHRATGNGYMAFAAAVVAGGMSSVWLNATETEVYAASLFLGVLMIWAADRAGRAGDQRWTCLTAYLMALSVPLHLSALVVAPAAILLAAYTGDRLRWPVAWALSGVFVLSMGVGRMSLWLCVAGAAIVTAAVAVRKREGRWVLRSPRAATAIIGVTAIAISALGFLYVRAQFDPGINQGNPDTFRALSDVVARRQYAVSPIWPREAPAWIQLANLGQYADWQVALSFGPTVLPSILRTLGTVLFLLLGYQGAITLWRIDRRMGLATVVLFLCGTLGVLVHLNLHAGPSMGYGILPNDTVREARERDYFFVFGFWAWGLWAGIGAVTLAARFSRPAWTGVLVACLPIVLNWRAVTRRGEPEQSLPRAVAESLLESAPNNAVLFVVGDNDSYPLWFAQQVLHTRRDVTVVTIPLLPTEWYRAELSRRAALLAEQDISRYEGKLGTAATIARNARRLGRPVAAANSMTADERSQIGKSWTARGLLYVEGSTPIDTAAVKQSAARVQRRLSMRRTRPAIDPVNEYFRHMLDCPRQLVAYAQKADSTRLDSVCNYR